MPFVTALGNIGTTRLFPFLLSTFDAGVAAKIDYCVNAQDTMAELGAISVRTADQNFFLAAIEFAKIGNILSYYADAAHAGTALAGFDPCAVGGARAAGGSITDDDARQIGVGLSIAAANLSAVAGTVSTGSSTLASITSVCAVLPAGYDFCSVTDPTALTANEVKGVRTLIKESNVLGLGANCTGDVTTCNCP
jgi:hypothetical protein